MLSFKEILKLTQEELLTFCENALLERGYPAENIISTKDYIYAEGEIPILLIAHTDIVHKNPPEIIVEDKELKILWSPTGIGGDDRCGVFAILKLCEEFKPYVLFTTEEEKGGIGAKKFVEDISEIPVNFMIEIDRRDNNQVVYYRCGNKDFQNYIESFGFEKKTGSFSDVSTLSTEYNIAGCNVSAGYYQEHTTTEHIYLQHLENTINKLKLILSDKENHKKYDCQEIKYEYNYSNSYYNKKYNYNYYDDYYDYYDDYTAYYNKYNKENKESDTSWYDLMLKKEEDYYKLNNRQWKKKYKEKKPASILSIYYNE